MKKILQKTSAIILAILTLTTAALAFTSNSAFADDAYFRGRQDNNCDYVLGMVSWDCNVEIKDESSLKSGIWVIASNIAVDLTVLAAYLVIGYVIYGGYLYMMSSGDPGKIATGKKTLVQAFIGLAIALLANVILNTILIALGADFTKNCAEAGQCVTNIDGMIFGAINWVISIAGIVALIFVVIGGISYMTSSGDPAKIQKAKHTILYSCIGLIIVALALTITAFVSGMIRNADESSYLINDTIISKEITPNVKTS